MAVTFYCFETISISEMETVCQVTDAGLPKLGRGACNPQWLLRCIALKPFPFQKRIATGYAGYWAQ